MCSVSTRHTAHRREDVIAAACETLRGITAEPCAGPRNEYAFRHRSRSCEQSNGTGQLKGERIIAKATTDVKLWRVAALARHAVTLVPRRSSARMLTLES